MLDFVAHRFDLLLATTIIESGLDIPNANTIFINEADRYGLADLHQLRGRVGRYIHRAYCYLLLDPNKNLTSASARRLKAIEEFSQMGAGFAIAMRDLEIRGAGNILGTEQSGHIAVVGYELYCSLLQQAVHNLKRQPLKQPIEVEIDLPGEGHIPRSYVPDMRLKIDLYRRLARISGSDELRDLRSELQDRFGTPPPLVEHLLWLAELRVAAHRWRIESIHVEPPYVVFRYRSGRLIRELAAQSGGRLRIVDNQSAYLPLNGEGRRPNRSARQVKSLLQRSRAMPIIRPQMSGSGSRLVARGATTAKVPTTNAVGRALAPANLSHRHHGTDIVQHRPNPTACHVSIAASLLAVNPRGLAGARAVSTGCRQGYYPNGQYASGQPSNGQIRRAATARARGFPRSRPAADTSGGPAPAPIPAASASKRPRTFARSTSRASRRPTARFPASYVGQPLPAGPWPCPPPHPAQLCEWAQILGRVGDDVMLTGDVPNGIDDMMNRAAGRIPPEKFAEQRAALVKEVTDGIHEFAAHVAASDPDPAKGMSPMRSACCSTRWSASRST